MDSDLSYLLKCASRPRDYLIVLLLTGTGLRVSEILELRAEQLGEKMVIGGKIVFVKPDILKEIKRHAPNHGLLIPYSSRTVQRILAYYSRALEIDASSENLRMYYYGGAKRRGKLYFVKNGKYVLFTTRPDGEVFLVVNNADKFLKRKLEDDFKEYKREEGFALEGDLLEYVESLKEIREVEL